MFGARSGFVLSAQDTFGMRVSVAHYAETLAPQPVVAPRDPSAPRLVETFLPQEDEHAEALVALLEAGPQDGSPGGAREGTKMTSKGPDAVPAEGVHDQQLELQSARKAG